MGNKKIIEELRCIISEWHDNTFDNNETNASEIIDKLSGYELRIALAYLVGVYKSLPDLLNNYWQRKSDACPLEASEQENQLKEWAKYIFINFQDNN